MSKVVRMYADSKYHNFKLYEWVESNADWEMSIVRSEAATWCEIVHTTGSA